MYTHAHCVGVIAKTRDRIVMSSLNGSVWRLGTIVVQTVAILNRRAHQCLPTHVVAPRWLLVDLLTTATHIIATLVTNSVSQLLIRCYAWLQSRRLVNETISGVGRYAGTEWPSKLIPKRKAYCEIETACGNRNANFWNKNAISNSKRIILNRIRHSETVTRCFETETQFPVACGKLYSETKKRGVLGATYDDDLRLIGKRVLVLIELFSISVTAEALRVIICSKSAISLQRGSVDPKF